jgi:PAS domain S-box-containing protein
MEDQGFIDRTLGEYRQSSGEVLHSAIMAHLAEGIVVFDAATKRIREVNPALCSLLGYTASELAGLTIYDIIAHDRASIDANVERITEAGRHIIGERYYRRKDGTFVTVEVSAVALKVLNGMMLCAVVRDTTERSRAEQAIRENEARLRLVLANFPFILFTLDCDGAITYAAGRGLTALGLTPEAIIGRPIFAVTRSPDVPDYVQRALAGERVAAEVVVADHRFAAHYTPLRDETGAVMGVVGAVLDVTAQHTAEIMARRMEAGLTEREHNVLLLLADDRLSYREIGVRLHIERSTVRTHLNNLAHKLGCDENRAAVVAAARERGLLDG